MKKIIITTIVLIIIICGMFKYLECLEQRDMELMETMSNYQKCVIGTYGITVNDFIEQGRVLPLCEK